MSELTPEEKRKIYEEEKARIEAQQQILKKTQKRKTSGLGWGCLAVIAVLIIGYVIGYSGDFFGPPKSSSESQKSEPKKEEVELKARITFTGTQFVIQNNNQFDWSNVRLEVNRGYYYDALKMKSLTEYKIGAAQFAKRDGTRFSPFTMKPRTFFISADTPKGRAYYTAEWK